MRLSIAIVGVFALAAAGCDTGTQTPQAASDSRAAPEAGAADAGPIIPRELLFGNPERSRARLSPDGDTLSWLAPDEGVMNVWVAPADDMAAARAITEDRGRGIGFYGWAANGTHIIYVQDRGGDENFHAYSVHVETGDEVNLTPFDGVRAIPIATAWETPDIMIVGVNNRDAAWHDVYSINIVTGERALVYENTDNIGQFWTDDDLNLRLGGRQNPDGSSDILKFEAGEWTPFYTIPYEDSLTSSIIGFDETGERAFAVESMGRDKSALVSIDLDSGARTVLGASDLADVDNVLQHPTTLAVEAYSVNYLKEEWTTIGDAVTQDFNFLRANLAGEFDVVDRTKADDVWVVAQSRAEEPTVYHLYNREAGQLTELFGVRPALADYALQPMHQVEIQSRDGLTLVSYLTLPPAADANRDGKPETTSPLVLTVHGGPWARDEYGYSSWDQWLANRGYAVLSVNFRASTGFGKAFVTAGDKEWAGKMHDDLLDGVQWAIDNGVTTPEQVAIMGGSYGGYATLVGLTFTPETFACGVDIVGPSNLETLLATIPPYWESFFQTFANAIGDPRTEEGRALLRERSPLYKAGEITRPLLIAQGANDPRVVKAESDQIVEAMIENAIPVTYIVFPDEGHGFARPENRLAFYSVTESFLAECLGGRFEPIGDAFQGSSLTVEHGAEYAPGLSEALEGHTPETRG